MWKAHCQREFRDRTPSEMETWKELYKVGAITLVLFSLVVLVSVVFTSLKFFQSISCHQALSILPETSENQRFSGGVERNQLHEMVNVIEDKCQKRFFNPAGIYLLKANNRNTRARFEICSKLTIKTPERHQWRSIVTFEHVIARWEYIEKNDYVRTHSNRLLRALFARSHLLFFFKIFSNFVYFAQIFIYFALFCPFFFFSLFFALFLKSRTHALIF